jgi:hypothetical protein
MAIFAFLLFVNALVNPNILVIIIIVDIDSSLKLKDLMRSG